jgi:hypothetical protein
MTQKAKDMNVPSDLSDTATSLEALFATLTTTGSSMFPFALPAQS